MHTEHKKETIVDNEFISTATQYAKHLKKVILLWKIKDSKKEARNVQNTIDKLLKHFLNSKPILWNLDVD